MLTDEESKFIEYWAVNRDRKKKVLKQLYIGLPLATVLVIAIFLNFFSGWYKRADYDIRSYPSLASLIITLVIAAILIVVFTTVFSVRHKWDIHETRYRELLARKDQI